MRKEYNDRWNAPLVNPGFTVDENGTKREIGSGKVIVDAINEIVEALNRSKPVFTPTIKGESVE